MGDPEAVCNGWNTTINIPLPPGSGKGAYAYTFSTVVLPALTRFAPEMIFVSSGFDASYADPLAAMMLSAEDYRAMAAQLVTAAETLCEGRLLFAHEGGYSKDFVPFCCLAVVEELCGGTSAVEHSYDDVYSWGYQALQPHQAAVVDAAAGLAGLRVGRCSSAAPGVTVAPVGSTCTTTTTPLPSNLLQPTSMVAVSTHSPSGDDISDSHSTTGTSGHSTTTTTTTVDASAGKGDQGDQTGGLSARELQIAAAIKVLLDCVEEEEEEEEEGKPPAARSRSGRIRDRKRVVLSHVVNCM